jgi:hypothetical protein
LQYLPRPDKKIYISCITNSRTHRKQDGEISQLDTAIQ